MPTRTHTCITLSCDVCGVDYKPDDYTPHFTNLAQARDCTHADGWTITADAKVLCDTRDDEHQAFMDALLPPAPVMQVPGQVDFDGGEAP